MARAAASNRPPSASSGYGSAGGKGGNKGRGSDAAVSKLAEDDAGTEVSPEKSYSSHSATCSAIVSPNISRNLANPGLLPLLRTSAAGGRSSHPPPPARGPIPPTGGTPRAEQPRAGGRKPPPAGAASGPPPAE